MKPVSGSLVRRATACVGAVAWLVVSSSSRGETAPLLFEDDFNQGIPGWTAVLPPGAMVWNGTMLWQYDIETGWIWENSNVYSDSATYSATRTAAMLINDTVAPASNFTFTVRLRSSDDDACGLIWGYRNPTNFYRVEFANQSGRTLWPHTGWNVDRVGNGEGKDLFGVGDTNAASYVPFTYTKSRFFDVTVGVTNGLFSLSVVDDPTNDVPTLYELVSNQPLPEVVAGKVGVFTWGQSATVGDGLPNVGVRVHAASLLPTPLAGMTNPLVPTWTTLVTPRADGTTTLNQTPIWSLALSVNGTTSRLREASGTYLSADNVAAGATNFAAATIVAGDVNWTNYVFSTRYYPADDDGWGMMVRYQNPTNWYRVGFRRQDSGSGCKRGMSIQKCVDGIFDEVAAVPTAFPRTFPTVNVPSDVYVAALGQTLQVVVVADPTSANPTLYSYGPYTDTSLANGMIGFFAWAQLHGEHDFARVQAISGQGLQVFSTYGTPEPPVGLNDLPSGSTVVASVPSVVYDLPGARRVSTGWQGGAGDVPATGTTNSVTFTLNQLSLISWTWRTEFQLNVAATGGGKVLTAAAGWVADGSNVVVSAQADPGYLFLGWSGDAVSTVVTQSFAMTGPRTLTARFAADSDSDGLADDWELQYFSSLGQSGTNNPDGDGLSNEAEYISGTNPNYAETLIVSDGLSSRWENVQRDVALPGQMYVVDFGSGYRGMWDAANDYRYGNDSTFIPINNLSANYDSFQGAMAMVRPDLWNEAWASNFSASVEWTVGDNDGSCFYFRYLNASNWFRVTLSGENEGAATWRPPVGLSVQRRVDGVFSAVPLNFVSGPMYAAYTDPVDGNGDPAGFKKVRLTVNATNENFEVRVIGWNWSTSPAGFDPAVELVETFSDTSNPSGRIGFGAWGQGILDSSAPDTSTNGIPIPSGSFLDNLVLKSPADGAVVLSENWESAALQSELPAGWENPYPTNHFLYGSWFITAHGTIAQQSNTGTPTSGSTFEPKADGDGPILLAPAPASNNYVLNIGFHPFDDDGIGFVYNFQDTNNYSRVLFRQQTALVGEIPAGLSVSRKSGGVWTDVVAGDTAFLYTPGTPFEVEFAFNNGNCRLSARDSDNPAKTAQWSWADSTATAANRFGLAVWSESDAHFSYAKAYGLPTLAVTAPVAITNITVAGGVVALDISKSTGSLYHVLRACSVSGPYVTNAASQSATRYTEPQSAGSTYFYRLQLVQ